MDIVLSSPVRSGTTLPWAVVRAKWFIYGCWRKAEAGDAAWGGPGGWYIGLALEARDCVLKLSVLSAGGAGPPGGYGRPENDL